VRDVDFELARKLQNCTASPDAAMPLKVSFTPPLGFRFMAGSVYQAIDLRNGRSRRAGDFPMNRMSMLCV
jgi:hypothetical protein